MSARIRHVWYSARDRVRLILAWAFGAFGGY